MQKCRLRLIIVICVSLLLFSGGNAFAFYPFKSSTAQNFWKTSGFGEFRTSGYLHDGTDISANMGTPVYAVAPGKVEMIDDSGKSPYGSYVIINHGTFKTRYCHLSGGKKGILINARRSFETKTNIDLTKPIALSSNTGKGNAAVYGPHLHIEYWNSNGKKVDPITAGLDQPNNGNAYVYNGPRMKRGKVVAGEDTNGINFVTAGDNRKFNDSNGPGDREDDELWTNVIPLWQEGDPVRIVVEAYDEVYNGAVKKDEYTPVPQRIDVKITDSSGNIVKDKWGNDSVFSTNFAAEEFAVLDSKAKGYPPLVQAKTFYCIKKPLESETLLQAREKGRIYFYWKWYPAEARNYNLHVDVYDNYRSAGMLQAPITDTRDVNFSLGLYGYDFNEGVGIASASDELEIIYSRADPYYFSPNSTTGNLPDKATIYARANKEASWTINILDQSLNVIKSIDGGTGEETRVEWDGRGAFDGKYYYQVLASASGESAYYDGDEIELETQAPVFTSLNISGLVEIRSATDNTKVSFSSNEDLYSAKITVLDKLDNEVVYLGYIPGVFANQIKTVIWDWAGDVPNGTYRFKVVATDMAGNKVEQTSSSITVNIPDNSAPELDPIPREDGQVENLPELPAYEDRPIISDIDFDSAGNQYVLYGRYNKLVKYNSAGEIVKIVDKFNDTKFRLPLGLAVSPSGDRVYVADTYNNRTLVYDEKLQPLKSISRHDVYLEQYREKLWSKTFFNLWMFSNDDDTDKFEHYYEAGNLPADIVFQDNSIYVVDSANNRVLKFNRNGKQVVFDVEKYYFKNEHSDIMSSHKIERWGYSNTINDTLANQSGRYEFIDDKYDFDLKNELYGEPYPGGFVNWGRHVVGIQNAGNANGQFTSPESVAVDKYGNLYVADTSNNRIQKFAPSGEFLSKFGGTILNDPKGIDVDSSGSIWVADTGNKRIVQFGPSGDFIKEYKSDEYEIDPQKIVIKDGKLYIADANHNESLVWDIAGEITNFKVSDTWFSPNSDGSKDDLNISYNLSQPADVTIQAVPKAADGAAAQAAEPKYALNNANRSVGYNQEIWAGSIQSSGSSAQSTEDGEANTIADGSYDLKVIASFGDYKKVKTVDIDVDTQKPSLTLTRDPPAISPNADGINDEMLIEYSISDNLSPTAEVKLTLWKNNVPVALLYENNSPLPLVPSEVEGLGEGAGVRAWTGQIGSYWERYPGAQGPGFRGIICSGESGEIFPQNCRYSISRTRQMPPLVRAS